MFPCFLNHTYTIIKSIYLFSLQVQGPLAWWWRLFLLLFLLGLWFVLGSRGCGLLTIVINNIIPTVLSCKTFSTMFVCKESQFKIFFLLD